jgi:predicted ABC-class ATPase
MLQNSKNLESKIYNINNKGYKAYQNFKGAYDFGRYQLFIKAENPLWLCTSA